MKVSKGHKIAVYVLIFVFCIGWGLIICKLGTSLKSLVFNNIKNNKKADIGLGYTKEEDCQNLSK